LLDGTVYSTAAAAWPVRADPGALYVARAAVLPALAVSRAARRVENFPNLT
jgi:hypothetical protein